VIFVDQNTAVAFSAKLVVLTFCGVSPLFMFDVDQTSADRRETLVLVLKSPAPSHE
jgi:hypothetical protein